MADRALGAGQHGVVIGQHRKRRTADARGPGQQTVGRRVFDEVVQTATVPLRRDREAPVLDERPVVDQVIDVLARGTAPGRMATGDRVGPARVLRQRPAA